MSRHQLINHLVRAEYPLISDTLLEIIKDTRAKNRGDPHIDDIELEVVWKKSGRRFKVALLSEPSDSAAALRAKVSGDLTSEARSKLRDYLSRAQEFEDTLNDMEDAQIVRMHDSLEAGQKAERSRRKADKGAKADVLAFFNRATAVADLTLWSKKAAWTVEEAAALSLGKDPRVVNASTLGEYTQLHGSPFRDSFLDRVDALERAVKAKQLPDPITPAKFKMWARLHENGVSSEILADLGSGRSAKGTGVHRNHLHKCYLIILGLAMKHYDYNPLIALPEKHAEVVKKLGADLESKWASVNARTLSNILKDAATLENEVAQVLQASSDWARESDNKVLKRPGLKRPLG